MKLRLEGGWEEGTRKSFGLVCHFGEFLVAVSILAMRPLSGEFSSVRGRGSEERHNDDSSVPRNPTMHCPQKAFRK